MSVTFQLRDLTTTSAKCFFCQEPGCDKTFLAWSKDPLKTRGHAAHSQCVDDHMELQGT